jgi:hypothetical protein
MAACSVADAERVEGGERVRSELNAGANLLDPVRLFENLDLVRFASECQRSREATDSAPMTRIGVSPATMVIGILRGAGFCLRSGAGRP